MVTKFVDRLNQPFKYKNMSCEECCTRFSVFKRKKQCEVCLRFYCRQCLIPRRDDYARKPTLMRFAEKKYICRKCRIMSTRPLHRSHLLQLRVKDLQFYLSSQKISTRGCVEKDDLVNLLLHHVGSTTSTNRNASTGFHSQTDLSWRENLLQQRSNSVEDFLSSASPLPSLHRTEINLSPNNFSENGSANSYSSLHSDSSNIAESSNGSSGNQQDESSPATISPSLQTEETKQSVSIETGVMACSGISLQDIRSIHELEKLSVKQIKELLILNRVDFRGCCEKVELMERLTRLWQDNHNSRQDLETLSLQELCKICMDAPVECVMLECGHMATCMSCGKQLSECPICRQFVVRVVRTFRA